MRSACRLEWQLRSAQTEMQSMWDQCQSLGLGLRREAGVRRSVQHTGSCGGPKAAVKAVLQLRLQTLAELQHVMYGVCSAQRTPLASTMWGPCISTMLQHRPACSHRTPQLSAITRSY